MQTKPNILLLANTSYKTQAVRDHINAVQASDSFSWHIANPIHNRVLYKYDLSKFAAIVIHYSTPPHRPYYFPTRLLKAVKAFKGKKLLFLQDENYDVNLAQTTILKLEIDVLFTCLRPEYYAIGYPELIKHKVKLITVLTGYVPNNLLALTWPNKAQRHIDIFYRSREYEYWTGKLARLKYVLTQGTLTHGKRHCLNLDISLKESDRVYQQEWLHRLLHSKAVLASESGSSIWDFDGDVKRNIIRYLKHHKKATFDQVFEAILKPIDGTILYNAISPRMFEAVACGTLLIMFPGYYDGIFKADRDYLCLQPNFSNFDDIIAKLQDANFCQNFAMTAYSNLIQSDQYHYHTLTQLVSHEISTQLNLTEPQMTRTTQRIIMTPKYGLLNYYYNFIREASFVTSRLWWIARDPRYTLKQKWGLLISAIQRYQKREFKIFTRHTQSPHHDDTHKTSS